MRKLYTILAILLVLCSAGCEAKTQLIDEGNIRTSETTPTAAGTQGWQSRPTFTSLEDYEKYVSSGVESSTFITYDMVKEFGTFASFVDYGAPKCKSYKYGLIDKNGYTLNLHIRSSSEELLIEEELKLFSSTHNTQDMRIYTQNGYQIINDIYFFYNAGNLVSIVWDDGEIRYKIRSGGTKSLSDYSIQKETPLSRLLNAETAEAAVAEFNAKVAQARAEKAG